MPDLLQFDALSHLNLLADGYEATKARLQELFGVQINLDIPAREGDDTDAFLFTLGGVITEAFCPQGPAERGQGKLLVQHGPHHLGVEVEVADVDAAREICQRRGVRIIRDDGPVFFTHPGACCGIAWEIFGGNFSKAPSGGTEGQDPPHPHFTLLKPATYWQDEHPMGVVGLARITVAVRDLEAATETFRGLVASEVIDEPSRPGARAIQLQVGDMVFELLSPTESGALSAFLDRYGDKVRSNVYRVLNLARVQTHLAAKGVVLVPGDSPDAFALPPDALPGLGIEFTES